MGVSATRGPRQHTGREWARCHETLIAFGITMLAAVLRLYDIAANGFNLDEIWSVWLTQHDMSFILQFTTMGGEDVSSPPVFYLLMRAFVLLGNSPLLVRLVSVLAGTFMVWLTFRLALDLFDLRVATISAFLLAIAPLHIAWSRVARAYVPSAVLVLLSLFFFARILFKEDKKWYWLGLVIASALAVWTHYLMFLVVLFENAVIALLWLRHRLPRRTLTSWLLSQFTLAILILPALLAALSEATGDKRYNWVPPPSLDSLIKSVVLFGTGDPSHGPMGLTPARGISFLIILGFSALGVWVFLRRGYHRRLDEEGRRVVFLVGVLAVPAGGAILVSLVRPLYAEKYFLYVMPALFILFAWAITRTRQRILASVLLLLLVVTIGLALHVFYTEPFGEQWREAVAYMHPKYQPDDLVVVAPGWHARPYAFYFSGDFPENAEEISYAPAVVVEDGEFRAFSLRDQAENLRASDPSLAASQRIWFISGYSPVDSVVTEWIKQNFESVDSGEFLGANVRLLQRISAQDASQQE